MNYNPFNASLGLALGGGGAKGIAHIGVLKSIKENNLDISYISGTSAGAIVASYFAFQKDLDLIEGLGDKLNAKNVLKFSFNSLGYSSTNSIREMLLKDIGDVKIEDAPIPLAICTTDIIKGESYFITHGSLIDAVCASVAVPGLFVPIEMHNRLLADGGITENLPVNILKEMGAGIIIAVDLSGTPDYPKPKNVVEMVSNGLDIAIDFKTKKDLKKADIPISLDLSAFSKFDNSENKNDIINIGYQTTEKQISKLKRHYKLNFFYAIKEFIKENIPFRLRVPQVFKNK